MPKKSAVTFLNPVDAFINKLDHPLKELVISLRELILKKNISEWFKASGSTMIAISPLTDFSYDFHDLDFKRLQ